MNEFITAWANVIAQFEGFNTPGSRPARNHNPGDLKFAGQPGAIGKDPQNFAVFPDDQAGWQALYNQLARYVSEFPNYSILQIMAHYLGQSVPTSDSQGNAFSYARAVASAVGTDVNTTLTELATPPDATGVQDASVINPGTDGSQSGLSNSETAAWVLGGLVFIFLIWAIRQ